MTAESQLAFEILLYGLKVNFSDINVYIVIIQLFFNAEKKKPIFEKNDWHVPRNYSDRWSLYAKAFQQLFDEQGKLYNLLLLGIFN